jgi:hypothetical protein
MKGDKKTFSECEYFYKEYSKNEFYYLKMLHGVDGLHLDTITKDGIQYIEMPAGHVISIDTIPKNNRSYVRNIIVENIPFMIEQILLLNNLGIYYSDCLQWLYYNNRMYLIDFDAAFFHKIDYNYNNYDLLINFLIAFDINSSYITESLHYLTLFKQTDIEFTFYNESEKELYKKLNDPSMQKNHIYYAKNQRHIQIDTENIHIYGKTGNMVITENILNPEIMSEWELIKIA